MKKLFDRVLTGFATGALAIATVGAMSAPMPAQATVDTYTPHGGPGATFIGHDIAFSLVEASQTFTCEQFDLLGSINAPGIGRAFGSAAATWDQVDYNGCTNPIMGDTWFEGTGIWELVITGPEAGSVSPATLTDLELFVQIAGCEFKVAGEVTGAFDDLGGAFTPTGSTLTITDDPAGFICPVWGLIKGDGISVSGTWRSIGLSITNP